MARVSLKGLTKRFENVTAIDNLNLEIKDKMFTVLLGPSGCGKTTTLRCIAGLDVLDEGEIYIGDTLVNDLPPKDRDVALVFQSYALYPHMTVFDNIAFPLKMRKAPKEEIRRRVRATAELLRIVDLLDRKPKQLSGGEAQRTALGRAIVREPKVFLMDEPLSNLDAKLRLYMRVELKSLQRQLGVTTIYVTHDQAEAMSMSDEIVIMNSGVIQQVDNPAKVYDHPANLFIAGFVGSPPTNFIDCSFREKNESGFLDAGIFILPLSDDMKKTIKDKATNSELVLGVRPEDIFMEKRRSRGAFIEAEVYGVEPLGSEVIVDLKSGENQLKARTTPTTRVHVKERIWIGFNRDRMHIFDKKTTEAIV